MKTFTTILVVIHFTQGLYGQPPVSTQHPDCKNVLCLQPDCPNPIKPRGKCCARCPTRPDHCAGLMCDIPNCPDYITLPGHCCPSCPTPPVDCSAVRCANPQCRHPITPPGQCCPQCPRGNTCIHKGTVYTDGEQFRDDCNMCLCSNRKVICTPKACPLVHKPCFHKGMIRQHGERFNVDCNTCSCSNGLLICTLMACIQKHGTCPLPDLGHIGICMWTCDGDSSCPGNGKCCGNGCGNTCMLPQIAPPVGKPCFLHGEVLRHGESFRHDCNTCRCSNGRIGACTRIGCLHKPGKCPLPGSSQIGKCLWLCNGDASCPGNGKCCSNGCGDMCMQPEVTVPQMPVSAAVQSVGMPAGGASGLYTPVGKPCFHNGYIRDDGERFMDDCNNCWCSDGSIGCTKRGCLQKQGQCPLPGFDEIGSCVWMCNGDSSCPGNEKCCRNGCGEMCMLPQVTPPVGQPCFHKGQVYPDGVRFNVDCNTCICSNGVIGGCTLMGCLQKPGACPLPGKDQIGMCMWLCDGDSSCPGSKKCCPNGCGDICMQPQDAVPTVVGNAAVQSLGTPPGGVRGALVGGPCFHRGTMYRPGDTFMDDCNTCTCLDNGGVGCSLMACPPVGGPCFHRGTIYRPGDTFMDDCNTCTCLENGGVGCSLMGCLQKPGQCPPPVAYPTGVCQWMCNGDSSCTGDEKCCSGGCGEACMLPQVTLPSLTGSAAVQSVDAPWIGGGSGHCVDAICPEVECQNRKTPHGQCCPVCISVQPNCADAVCATVYCEERYIPPGQCCSVCTPNP